MKNWYFGVGLLVTYLGVFHLWMYVDRKLIIIIGLVVVVALSVGLFLANRRGYFLNNYDVIAHASVILDILLETLLPLAHDHYGFYLCALAFCLAVGGYHLKLLKQGKLPKTSHTVPESTIH